MECDNLSVFFRLSGVPERNDRHAAEIGKVALDLLAKVIITHTLGWPP